MSYISRIGLEFETLLDVITQEKQKMFQLINPHPVNLKAPENCSDLDFLHNSVNHLIFGRDPDTENSECDEHGPEHDVVKVNTLAQLLNKSSKVINGEDKPLDNKSFFKVTDGYKMAACMPPNGDYYNPKIGKELDTKYTWVVTQDSSVKYEYDDDEDGELIEPHYYTDYDCDKTIREFFNISTYDECFKDDNGVLKDKIASTFRLPYGDINIKVKDIEQNGTITEKVLRTVKGIKEDGTCSYPKIYYSEFKKRVLNGIEIVSPPLRVRSDETDKPLFSPIRNDIINFIKTLKGTGMTVFNNRKTSNHVHITFADPNAVIPVDKPDFKDHPIWVNDPFKLLQICFGWLYFEPVFFMLCGYWRRSNEYAKGLTCIVEEVYNDLSKQFFSEDICKIPEAKEGDNPKKNIILMDGIFAYFGIDEPINASALQDLAKMPSDKVLSQYSTIDFGRFNGKMENLVKLIQIVMLFQGHPGDQSCRYAGLNLLNTVTKVGTVEVRIKQGTTDPKEIYYWIELIECFFLSLITKDTLLPCEYKDKKDTLNDFFKLSKIRFDSNEVLQSQPQTIHGVITRAKGVEIISKAETRKEKRNIMEKAFCMLIDRAKSAGMSEEAITFWTERFSANMNDCNKETFKCPEHMKEGGGKKGRVPQRFKVFCYGSNGTKQLTERVQAAPGEIVAKGAVLKGYKRVFAGYSERWEGGVASIHPATEKSRVFGSVVELTQRQIKLLDQYEGGYKRTKINVTIGTKDVECFVYIKKDHTFVSPPSHDYLRAIRRMLQETKFAEKPIEIIGVFDDCKNKSKVLKKMGVSCI
jgi:gamma-glutamylcyclotransferase (GGCT)/AIG2-like uncharacterized protein YtfP